MGLAFSEKFVNLLFRFLAADVFVMLMIKLEPRTPWLPNVKLTVFVMQVYMAKTVSLEESRGSEVLSLIISMIQVYPKNEKHQNSRENSL